MIGPDVRCVLGNPSPADRPNPEREEKKGEAGHKIRGPELSHAPEQSGILRMLEGEIEEKDRNCQATGDFEKVFQWFYMFLNIAFKDQTGLQVRSKEPQGP